MIVGSEHRTRPSLKKGKFKNYDTYLMVKCDNCGKVVFRPDYDVRRWDNQFCSARCRRGMFGVRNVWWEHAFAVASKELRIGAQYE